MADPHTRIAVALERIADALESPQQKAHPLTVDKDETHQIAEDFKSRSGIKF